jgi:quercetin dioxygenase-like cupin family protein
LTEYGSEGARVSSLARSPSAGVVRIEVDPGGRLAMHSAERPQLFVVTEGEGTVQDRDGEPQAVSAGHAIWWDRGEVHETRSESGLAALVIQAHSLEPTFTPTFW